jgi:hypothetical protein
MLFCLFFSLRHGCRDPEPAASPTAVTATVSSEPETITATIDGRPIDSLFTDDPADDGWHTEVFSKAAKAQLKILGSLLEQTNPIDTARLTPLVTNKFSCSGLRPANLQERYADEVLTVLAAENPQDPAKGLGPYHGVDGLAEALGRLREPFAGGGELQVDIKIFRVEQEPDRITTRQHVSIRARGSAVSSIWESVWQTSNPPRLHTIGLVDYRETILRTPETPLFADCTEAAIGGNDFFREQLMHGTFHWIGRLERAHGQHIAGYSGLAIGDVNGDGLDDLYLCEAGGLPNRLFIQNPDSTATDRSSESGVNFADTTVSALLVDLDNDADQDLAIGTRAGVVILENDGTGHFEQASHVTSAGMGFALCAADYDEDGDLDLFVGRYNRNAAESDRAALPIPYYDANNGARNFLLRNDGDFEFTDVTVETGLDANNSRFTFSAAWEDYDNDGDQDLYLANDFGRNCLYRNDGGTFVDVAATADVEDIASGMSVTWGDYNRDGLMDVYVSNMYSNAGNRIVTQDQFTRDLSPFARKSFQRLARGNTLFANNGDSTFTDVSVDAGVTMGRWAWSSLFCDLNNNGWDDILVTNGNLSAPDTKDL